MSSSAVLAKQSSFLPEVKKQYESLPYPHREPADEEKRMVMLYCLHPDRLHHFLFKGEQRLFQKGARILIAGGGTGDAGIYLGYILKDYGVEIVHLDMSEASIDVAKKRAEIRELSNITYVKASLLDIPKLGLGTFDFIDCTGVLHHLASPEDGMQALASALKPDGGMQIMLYGLYGRTAIYPVQRAMRMVYADDQNADAGDKIRDTRSLIRSVPQDHWLRQQKRNYEFISHCDDAEIYDMFLHSQDKPYDMPAIHALLASAHLHWVDGSHAETRHHYYAERLIREEEKELRERVVKLPKQQQQAIAEIISGGISRHEFYVSPKANRASVASAENAQLTPFWDEGWLEGLGELPNLMQAHPDKNLRIDIPGAEYFTKNMAIYMPKSQYAHKVLRMIDGKQNLQQLYSKVASESRCSVKDVMQDFIDPFNELSILDALYLRR